MAKDRSSEGKGKGPARDLEDARRPGVADPVDDDRTGRKWWARRGPVGQGLRRVQECSGGVVADLAVASRDVAEPVSGRDGHGAGCADPPNEHLLGKRASTASPSPAPMAIRRLLRGLARASSLDGGACEAVRGDAARAAARAMGVFDLALAAEAEPVGLPQPTVSRSTRR